MKKIILITLLILVVATVGLASYLTLFLPDVDPAPKLKVLATTESIKHGEYLATNVAACMDCHSSRDWTRFSGPLKNGTLGMGGEYFGPEMGFPGKFYARNLTPTNLGDWTDGEIFRAITSGVNKDGKALFPVMPYPYYNRMDKNDVLDIIAYLRSLSPIENEIPTSEIQFPMNFIMNTFPKKPIFSNQPDRMDSIKYGEYLINTAACMDCHTQADKGQLILDKAFAGGREFILPNGIARSANITPDKKTGIGSWPDSLFINRFKAFSHPENFKPITNEQVNTIMPWTMYAGMETHDLQAIFSYLKTIKPIQNEVIHFQHNGIKN